MCVCNMMYDIIYTFRFVNNDILSVRVGLIVEYSRCKHCRSNSHSGPKYRGFALEYILGAAYVGKNCKTDKNENKKQNNKEKDAFSGLLFMHLMLLNENLKGRFNKGVKAHFEDKNMRRANACMLGHTPCQYVVYSTKQRTYRYCTIRRYCC